MRLIGLIAGFLSFIFLSTVSVAAENSKLPKQLDNSLCLNKISSYTDVMEVVSTARLNNKNLPKEEFYDLKIYKERCHFYYYENTQKYFCKNKEYSEKDIFSFVKKAREKFSDIPELKIGSETSFRGKPNASCTYKYYEKIKPELGAVDLGKRHHFIFDQNGDLIRFYSLDRNSFKKLIDKNKSPSVHR